MAIRTRSCFLFLFAFLPALYPVVLVAQSGLKKADRRFDRFAYPRAAKLYQKYLESHPGDQKALEKTGDCYRKINAYEEAEKYYAEAMQGEPSAPIYHFYYGDVLMNMQKYDEAIAEFETFLKLFPDDALANEHLEASKKYREFMKSPTRFKVFKTNVNTPEADFSPSIHNDKLVFASARMKTQLVFGWTDRSFLDLYAAPYEGKPELGRPSTLKGTVNTKFHEGGVSFSPDGSLMYFTRNNYYNGKATSDNEGTILLKTYCSELKGKRWTSVRGMTFNSDQYSTGHPAVFESGNKMIIVSDMPGGQGGTDLYLVVRHGNEWGRPHNLGPEINTEGNEMFPWVAKDGTLYYASNGFEGLGGLDLFSAEREGDEWIKPANLGFPMNTSKDDFGLVYDEENNIGFFTSNRDGGEGDDDIYAFEMKKVMKIRVIDEATGQPLDSARVSLFDSNEDMGDFEADANGIANVYIPDIETFSARGIRNGYDPGDKALTAMDFTEDNQFVVDVPVRKRPVCPVEPPCESPVVLDVKVSPKSERAPVPGTKVKVYSKEEEFDLSENPNFFDKLVPGKNYYIEVDEQDVPPRKFEITTAGLQPNDTLEYEIMLAPAPQDVGKVFYIIYYNYDKHDIRKDASDELDRLVRFMNRNPKVKVELGSHTDSRGTDAYNESLSRNRAIEAFEYITSKGISKDRLSYKWFGEKELTNKCADGVDCSEQDHQLNRRTEFRLIGI